MVAVTTCRPLVVGGWVSDDAVTLARSFAAHLRHLREFRGIAYLGADDLPRGEPLAPEVRDDAPVQAVDQGRTHARADAPRPMPTPVVDRSSAVPAPTPARPPASVPVRTSLPQAAATDVREQARNWSAAEKLTYLRDHSLGECRRCGLAQTRTKIVFGVGSAEAAVMFIGEAPGFDEDRQGEPFVGLAGRRLSRWIERLGMTRDQVYIANVLKCRPPGNRDPAADEVKRCSPFLRAQIRAISPKVIVALGRHAGMLLLGLADRALRDMRGRAWRYEDASGGFSAPLFVTYHPSYVIRRENELAPGQRNPADETVMSDLQQAIQSLR